MTEPNSQNEKPEEERRYDPELLKKGLHCDLDQYEMLKRCSDTEDITEWNEWRIKFPTAEVLLQGAPLDGFYLNGAFLNTGTFKDHSGTKRTFHGRVRLHCASLKKVRLKDAKLHRANLQNANLEGAKL